MRPRIFKDARTAQRLRSFLAPRTRKCAGRPQFGAGDDVNRGGVDIRSRSAVTG